MYDSDLVNEGYHTNCKFSLIDECDMCISYIDGFHLVFYFQYQIDRINGGIGNYCGLVKQASGDIGFQLFSGKGKCGLRESSSFNRLVFDKGKHCFSFSFGGLGPPNEV
jgi:hypothetical protein